MKKTLKKVAVLLRQSPDGIKPTAFGAIADAEAWLVKHNWEDWG
jgi:hypothetical protein